MDTNTIPTIPDDDDHDVSSDLAGTYIKKSEIRDGGPQRHVIANVTYVVFEGRNGRPAQRRNVLTFTGEPARKLSLNDTNLRILARAWGVKARVWIGKALRVEFDPDVRFGSDIVGGLRVRPLRPATPTPPPPPAAAANEVDEEPVPF